MPSSLTKVGRIACVEYSALKVASPAHSIASVARR